MKMENIKAIIFGDGTAARVINVKGGYFTIIRNGIVSHVSGEWVGMLASEGKAELE